MSALHAADAESPASVASSSLDPPETAQHVHATSLPATSTEAGYPIPRDFRHNGWRHTYEATAAAMDAANLPHNRRLNFRTCGTGFWILRSKSDHTAYKLALDTCRDRFCIPCQRARAARIAANLQDHLADHPYRLITLTLRHQTEPLEATLRRLYTSFARIRRSHQWKEHVQGGVAFLETTYNATTSTWHAHFHILCEGKFFAHSTLRDLWQRSTGDSTIVDIRLVRNTDTVARYVTKYTTKPANLDAEHQPDQLVELIQTTTGKRTIIPFGTWTHWRLLSTPTNDGWQRYGHSNELGLNPYHDDALDAELANHVKRALTDQTYREFTIPNAHDPPD